MSNPREKIQSAREALERSDRAGANAEELRELRKAVGAVVDVIEGEVSEDEPTLAARDQALHHWQQRAERAEAELEWVRPRIGWRKRNA